MRRHPGEAIATPVLPPGKEMDLAGRGTVMVRSWPGPKDRRKARKLPPLVLIHGWTVTADLNFFRLYELLGERHTYASFDQRGHGRGLRPDQFTLEDCADDVIALADAMGWAEIVPVGYSMGGAIAQLVAHRHPERVAGLVLCSTSAVFSETRQDNIIFEGLLGLTARALRAAPPFLRSRVPGRLRAPDPESPLADWMWDETYRHDAALIAQAGQLVGRFRSESWLGTLNTPTAVVITASDTVVPPSRQRQLAASIPGATTHIVDLDHRAAVRDPALYFPVLDAALASVARRQRGRALRTVQHLVVSGRVQNVGFRQSMQRRAQDLGLSGWVRNRRDGRGEAVVAGAREKVEELVSWARQGPPMAEVIDVRTGRSGDAEVDGHFQDRPTE